ncbi:nuclease-related domain-containing protein [Streptomyces sp. DSM 42041]|uniref:Nuclease-related domain-containing protein n=1 Tax=Streptomyces hazeniae TaxID=3075538 RepID=A0ABU2NMK6_9ACTN|nr:nuclease-related domain-containing protein [Streptomyces sp. DSM 42041]MDT0377282.1 nuclease-related domain-containing protein [Streptomyces sp. DSM 42041]
MDLSDLLLIAAAAGTAAWLHRGRLWRRPRHGAGASAANRARQIRTPAVRLADALGITTRRGRQAARWQAGADGERRTADRLQPLTDQGWTLLHDRALPSSRANVDHLAISRRGVVVLVDSKRWSARYRLHTARDRLLHGTRDVTHRLDGLHHEASTVAELLGTAVLPVAVIDGAPVAGGELRHRGVLIVPADRALAVLQRLDRTTPSPAVPGRTLARRADRLLPHYETRTTR